MPWSVDERMLRCFGFIWLLCIFSFPCVAEVSRSQGAFNDFVLVYAGNGSRPNWDVSAFAKLLRCDGVERRNRIFFRSFVILETRTDDRKALAHPSPKRPANGPADDRDWVELLDRWFRVNGVLDSLNSAARNAREKSVDVWVGLPEPVVGGRFHLPSDGAFVILDDDDKLKAVNWLVEVFLHKWLSAKYDRLNFVGFYWVDESLSNTKAILAPSMSFARKRFRELGFSSPLKYLWIPFWRSPERDRWKELGFDLSVYQPNYYVKSDVSLSRLSETLSRALESGAGFEIEVDEKVFGDAFRMRKALSYLDAASAALGVGVVGVYQGNGALLRLGDEAWRGVYMPRLCDLIANRH